MLLEILHSDLSSAKEAWVHDPLSHLLSLFRDCDGSVLHPGFPCRKEFHAPFQPAGRHKQRILLHKFRSQQVCYNKDCLLVLIVFLFDFNEMFSGSCVLSRQLLPIEIICDQTVKLIASDGYDKTYPWGVPLLLWNQIFFLGKSIFKGFI